jgi:SagB-type dehydrogenase family enzyme
LWSLSWLHQAIDGARRGEAVKDALTIRLERDRALVSRDSGETWELTPRQVAELWSIDIASAKVPPEQLGKPTAALLASLAEAEALRPSATPVGPSICCDADGGGLKLGSITLSGSNTLRDVLLRRQSERALRPPDLRELATVLTRAGRVRGWRETPDGRQTETRALPSAGGCQPIDLHVLSTGISGLRRGEWRFDPLLCELHYLAEDPESLAAVGEDLAARGFELHEGFTAVFAIADFNRTLVRYPAGASLVWRDAGVVLAGLHLCAADIGLASCIVGSSGQLRSTKEQGRTDVGAVLLGHP